MLSMNKKIQKELSRKSIWIQLFEYFTRLLSLVPIHNVHQLGNYSSTFYYCTSIFVFSLTICIDVIQIILSVNLSYIKAYVYDFYNITITNIPIYHTQLYNSTSSYTHIVVVERHRCYNIMETNKQQSSP